MQSDGSEQRRRSILITGAAYAGKRVHWYAPGELADYDIEVTRAPEQARDRRIAGEY